MRRALLILSSICVGGLSACGSSPAPAPAKAASPSSSDKKAAKPDTAAATPTDAAAAAPFVYAYVPAGKRDPFRSPVEEMANAAATQLTQGPCNQPLCRWDLDQLKLVGVISGMSNPMAMVEDPQGIGYVVRRNSFMGKKGGRVTQIKHDSVVITEIVRGGDGKPHPTETDLHLTNEAEDASALNLLDIGSSE